MVGCGAVAAARRDGRTGSPAADSRSWAWNRRSDRVPWCGGCSAHDKLTLVELNEKFVEHLQRRFRDEEAFRRVAGQTRILHQAVEELPDASRFDHVISGLPLNNFGIELVERILGTFERLLAPGGTLSFFEYMGVRRLRSVVGRPADRARLTGISQALGALLERHGSARDWVWPNLPPAWVHHLKKNGEFGMGEWE